jgi:hypothetical protein
VGDELVRPTEEDLRGKIPAKFATEGALNGNGLKWKFLDAGRHIAAASLACHHEGLAA